MLETIRQSLAIDPRVLLLNAGSFLLLWFILDRIFWKPIMQHLERRKQRIDAVYALADEIRRQMESARHEYRTRLEEAEADARARSLERMRRAAEEREEILARAREEAERIVHRELEAMEEEHQRARAGAQQRLASAALRVLERAQGAPPDAEQRTLVARYFQRFAERN